MKKRSYTPADLNRGSLSPSISRPRKAKKTPLRLCFKGWSRRPWPNLASNSSCPIARRPTQRVSFCTNSMSMRQVGISIRKRNTSQQR